MLLLSVIGELRVGTSPRPVMATWLIVPEEPLCAAGAASRLSIITLEVSRQK
jgi:hypothetical protein